MATRKPSCDVPKRLNTGVAKTTICLKRNWGDEIAISCYFLVFTGSCSNARRQRSRSLAILNSNGVGASDGDVEVLLDETARAGQHDVENSLNCGPIGIDLVHHGDGTLYVRVAASFLDDTLQGDQD